MIKFFRNIRKKLIEQSKVRNYFFYAIGEIILVVIGILIALQINNWNQDSNNKKREYQYYNRLYEDVLEEKAILESTVNYSNQVIHHAKNAIAVFENSPNSNPNPIDNLIDMYQASQLQDPYSAESTYKELIASGQINLLQNDNLKTALIRYYEVNWTESAVFKLTNNYRQNLRGKMPDDIQSEIRLKCNDIYTKSRNGYQTSLPENCKVTIDYNVAKSVVDSLSKDDDLKRDLRYLIGNETGKLNDLITIRTSLNDLIKQLENLNNE